MATTSILIVDDEPLFSELLGRTLGAEPELAVVGIAHDGASAIRLARETRPDVVLMDIEMPGGLDGIEAAQQIQQERPETGIVLLSAHNDRRYLTSLPLGEGQSWSYLLKQTVPDLATLMRAILGSKQGMVVLDPAVVKGLRPRDGSALAGLTPRQQEVLALIAQGYSNAAIAQHLVLAEKSVETYIGAIYQHLQLSSEPDIHARVRATLLYLRESHTGPPHLSGQR
jgi:DNA-binding NarL/FixJ family response regulator